MPDDNVPPKPSSTASIPAPTSKPPDPFTPALTRSSTGVSLGRTASFASFRRPSATTERINEILETARERAETMGTTATAVGRAPGSPSIGRRTSDSTALRIPEDISVDETTGIVSHGSEINYQAIQTTNTQSSGPRARKTPSRNSNHSKPADNRPPAAVPDMDYSRQVTSEEKRVPWWQTQLQKFQSIELENKGSVARDHLAIERTFLAWLRTSLAFASIGIAVTQLFRLNTSLEAEKPSKNLNTLRQMGKPLGSTFLGISILILFLGYKRYFLAQQWVMQGKFPASRGTVTIVTFVAFAIMVVSLVVVIVIHPSEVEV